MKKREAQQFAKMIARDLFTNGAGQRASRLVLTVDAPHSDLGGWGEAAMADRIAVVLTSKPSDSETPR